MNLDYEPKFKMLKDMTLFVDVDSDPTYVLVLNAFALLDPTLWIMDNTFVADLRTITRRWPDRSIVLYAWEPDPNVHPKSAEVVDELGIDTARVEPRKVRQLLLERAWT